MHSALPALPVVRPISDLRTDLNAICEMAQSTHDPIFMTKNGKTALVVMDSEAYEEQRLHDRFVLKLREAEVEAKYLASPVTQEQLDAKMAEIFGLWGTESC